MTIADLLTLTGILLAIIAFISERNREYIFLKFSKRELRIIAIIFLYLHFLLSYSWWREKLGFLENFEFPGCPEPAGWAYILSISTLFWGVRKIFFGRFPLSNREKLMKYYEKLLLTDDITFLSTLIEKHHLKDIINYLRTIKNVYKENTSKPFDYEEDDKEFKKLFEKHIKTSSLIYAHNIYYRIILNEKFIENVANNKPYLFTGIIKELDTQELQAIELVNKFLKILLINKNQNLFREIKNNLNLGEYDAYLLDKSRPIIYSLFYNIDVANVNKAWEGIGEPAILEMYEEAKKDHSVLRYSREMLSEDHKWNYRVRLAIAYFDIMLRQAIKQKAKHHMHLYYYEYFIDGIIMNMENLPSENFNKNRNSGNFDLVEEIFSNMMDWKKVIIKTNNSFLLKCVCQCTANCIYRIANTEKLANEDKFYLVNWVWEDLIRIYENDAKKTELIEEIITYSFKELRKPIDMYKNEEGEKYLKVLNEILEKDTLMLNETNRRLAQRLKKEVLDK